MTMQLQFYAKTIAILADVIVIIKYLTIQPEREALGRAATARAQRIVYGFDHIPLLWD